MKGKLVALFLRLTGFGYVWDKIDGFKTYLTGGAEMLSGLSAMALSLSMMANAFVANTHNLGDVVNFVQAAVAHKDPAMIAFSAGWIGVLHGFGMISKKHADDKKHEELLAAGSTPVPPTVPPSPTPDAPASPAPASGQPA